MSTIGNSVCKVCNKSLSFRDGKCRICLLKELWLDNSNINDLGVFRFFRGICPKAFKNFKYGVPQVHKEIIYEVLRDEPGWKVFDRQIVVAAPRGIAKTTLLTKGFVLYCVAFGLKKYIVIASKTARSAQKSLRWVKSMLGSSNFISIFGDLRPKVTSKKLGIDQIEGKYTNEIIILNNGVTVEAIGMGQQLRSAAEGEEVNRVDLFISDDCETDENTATESSRENNETWLFETVFPSLDIDTGTLFFINTLTHTESILAKLLSSKGWRKRFYQITTVDDDGVERSIWPEKFPLSTINGIRQWYIDNKKESSFWKEYYNIIKSKKGFDTRWIRRYTGDYFQEHGYKWIRVKVDGSDRTEVLPVVMSLGIDSSFSLSESADWSVLLPLARCPDGRRFIFPISRGRYTAFDNTSDKYNTKGIISEAIRLHQKYNFNVITIDTAGQQTTMLELLKEEFRKEFGAGSVQIFGFNAGKEKKAKLDRLVNYLQPKYEAGLFHHLPVTPEIDRELIGLGDTTDDILDALFNADINSYEPEYINYNPIMLPKSHIMAMQKKPIRDWMVL